MTPTSVWLAGARSLAGENQCVGNDTAIDTKASRLRGLEGVKNWLISFSRFGNRGRGASYWPLAAVCMVAAVVLLWKLGTSSLYDWDEAIYAQISKEMVSSGDWLTPHWDYQPWFDKPPLYMWATAVLFRLFGISEFWARAPSAFSGIAVVGLTYLIGRRLYGRAAGLLAVAVLLTSSGFVQSARSGMTDVMLTMFIYLAIYSCLRLERGAGAWWYPLCLSCALAFLTKSSAALVAPVIIFAALSMQGYLLAALRSRCFWLAAGLALVLVAPWHIAMYAYHGQAFLHDYFGVHTVTLATSGIEGHAEGPFYYLDTLRQRFLPWVYLFPFALALAIWDGARRLPSLVILIAFIVMAATYTIIAMKIFWYIVPIYPSMALLLSSLVVRAAKQNLPSRIIWGSHRRAVVSAMFAVLLVVGIKSIGPLALFYGGSKTPNARLALMLRRMPLNHHQPIVVYDSQSVHGPSLLFYSDLPVYDIWDRGTFDKLFTVRREHKIVVGVQKIKGLERSYHIRVIREVGIAIYASVTRRTVDQLAQGRQSQR